MTDDHRGHAARLWLLLVLLGAYRLCLGWSGQLYWPDEYRYLHALHVLDELRQGDVSRAIYWIFGAEAGVASRPSFILLSLAPASVQGIANLVLDLRPEDPWFYRIPAIGNVFVSLGVTLAVYRLVVLTTDDRGLAWVGAAVHGLLANSNLYVRHLLPYDLSLALFLLSLLLVLDPTGSPRRALARAGLAGAVSGLGATTYPGYDPFLLIPLAILLARRPPDWRALALFTAGGLAVPILWEGVASLAGFSFFGASRQFSTTLAPEVVGGVQGAYEEGLSFLARYLIEVEGPVGVALGAGFLVFGILAVRGRVGRTETVMVLAAVLAYLAYAVVVQVLHKAVFYGRLVHMYLPFLVLAAMLAIRALPGRALRVGVSGTLLAASVLSFLPTASSALTLGFPRDIERDLRAAASGATICRAGQRDVAEGSAEACRVIIANGRHLYPLPNQWRTDAPVGYALAAQHRHPMQFRPYWFEGFKPEERERLGQDPPVISVYTRPGVRTSAGSVSEAARRGGRRQASPW